MKEEVIEKNKGKNKKWIKKGWLYGIFRNDGNIRFASYQVVIKFTRIHSSQYQMYLKIMMNI